MPVKKIRVSFTKIFVKNSGDIWGDGDWHLTTSADGIPVGDPSIEYAASEGSSFKLPQDKYSVVVDVSGKPTNGEVVCKMSIIDEDIIGHDELGEVKLVLRYPFRTEYTDKALTSPVIKGGWFSSDKQYYTAFVDVAIEEITASAATGGLGTAVVSRQAAGATTFSTVSGDNVTPRVEIHPVVPPPTPGTLWSRPAADAHVAPGADTIFAKAVPLTGSPPLNSLANPALIPHLSASDPDLLSKIAKVAITFMEPGDLDPSFFFWKIKSGPCAFHLGNTGIMVYVRGTGAPTDADAEAVIECRWKDATGPLLCTFRAFVGGIKRLPYRCTILRGSTAASIPKCTADHVQSHMDLANILMYHAGILLVPDSDITGSEGAVMSAHPGIFTNTVQNQFTLGVNTTTPPACSRINSRANVMNIVWVKSNKNAGAAGTATDRPGLSGADVTDTGSPSSSWVTPCGIPPQSPSGTVTMKSMPGSTRGTSAGDIAFRTARHAPADYFTRMFGLVIPDYAPTATDPDWPQTVAHEIGHVIGLRHRGNGANGGAPASADGINDSTGTGYPWLENVMCYGYARSQDFDLVQAKCIRAHPLCGVLPPI